jgi:3-oxoacyl-[acyl-carrier protein] reductase
VQLDVTCHDQVARAVAEVLERWGRIDVLINNAAITADELLWQITDQAWNRLLEVNLKGAFLCAQAVLSVMMRQHQGHIVNISSFSGRVGQRGQASYAAAKAGLLGLTTALAREAGAADVRVNAVLPGVLLTPMTAKLSPGRLQQLANANVLGRLNSISEVAQFILFLVNTENISGQIFQLDSRIAHWA